MIADHRSGRRWQQGNEEVRLLRDPATDVALALDHDTASQPRPTMAFSQPFYIMHRRMGSCFDEGKIAIGRLMSL